MSVIPKTRSNCILKGITMLSEERQRKNFDATGNCPMAWIQAAERFMASVRILRGHTNNFDPTRGETGDPIPDEGLALSVVPLLRGFAIECLLKALFLKKSCGYLAENGKYIDITGAGANELVQISNAVSVTFSADQRDVLKRLSIYMTSVGRYPIAKDWNRTKIQKQPTGGKGPPTYWRYPTDDEIVDSIEEMLMKELDV